MGPDFSEAPSGVPAGERLNVYALVIYIPDPLGRFLDDLRLELFPRCNPHAHVSVLPPRPLVEEWRTAREQVRGLIEAQAPFDVELESMRIFPVTNVIYIEVGAGASQLHYLHDSINRGALEFEEPFVYHPHITVAQEIPPEAAEAVHELAQRRWREF